MAFNIAIKIMLSLTVGLVFWFWAFLVFMVYAFMPVTKTANSIIFAVLAPLVYLAVSNWLLNKIFKETGFRSRLINLVITVGTMIAAVAAIDLISKVVR
ncbi:MAG TPA: hypothetical protein VNT57_06900 [Desulfobacteria bacterium]|nr:hypothetical protein [Desulfobacteria bacterium]